MRVQLAQQAREILGQSDLVMITERVDDVALLIGQMVTMGLPEVLDRHIPRHWTQRGLSWGWTAVIWLAYIVTEGDHRKVSVETYLKGMHHTLSRLTAQVVDPLDLSDDRLSHLLTHLSKKTYWHRIERDLNARSIEVYALPQDVIRCDATTVSGDHEVTEEGLVQFGHSKDDPTRPQIKVMMGSLDPLGMPVVPEYSYHVRRTSIRVSHDFTSGINHQAERVTTVSVAALDALISIQPVASLTTWSQTVRCHRVHRGPPGSKSG